MQLVPLYALVVPFVLWPIEQLLPYPFIIEELAKGVLVYLLLKDNISNWKLAALSGLAFSLTESSLYFFNIYLVGDVDTIFIRFLLTSALHTFTLLLIYFFAKKKRVLILPGILLAMVIHLFYNSAIKVLGIL